MMVLFLCSFSDCSRDHDCDPKPTTPATTTTSLEGAWQLVERSGGIAGRTEHFPQPGQDIRLVIGANGQYQQYVNGTLTYSTSWARRVEQSLLTGAPADMLVVDNNPHMISSLTSARLVLAQDVYDGQQETYERQAP